MPVEFSSNSARGTSSPDPRQRRQKLRDAELMELRIQIGKLKKAIDDCNPNKEKALKDADDRVEAAKQGFRDFARKSVESEYDAIDNQSAIDDIQKKIDGNKKSMMHEKRENKDLKKKLERVKKQLKVQQKSLDINESEGGDNSRAVKQKLHLEETKKELKELEDEIRKEKYEKIDEMAKIQKKYMDQFNCRSLAKDGLTRVCSIVKDKCRQRELRTEIVEMQQRCEKDAGKQEKIVKAEWEFDKEWEK